MALLVGGYYWSKQRRERQAALDEVRYSAVCDTARYVTEQSAISFDGFDPAELRALTFYLVRGGRVLRDTTVRNRREQDALAAFNIALPFARFRKTDTIVVATVGRNQRFYYISDFHHYAYLHYGMLGYLGSHDCRFADGAYLVNSRPYDGFLRKPAGLRALALPTRRAAR
ncbi:MAG: hypothetical protein ACRYFX_22235 [Janthinobacterium lividum]